MEKISVVVPVYNVENYLERCVDSIIEQTYKNLEIILVDDGSKDNSGKLCDELAQRDDRIKVIHKQNGGLSSARNCGIDNSTGKYIAFVDSDDYIESKTYEILTTMLLENKTKIAICGFNYVYDNGKQKTKIKENKRYVFNFFDSIKEMNTFEKFDMSACTKLFYKSLFDNIRFPEGKLSEDYYIMYKLFEGAQTVSYTSECLYNYYQRKNSITKSKKINTDFSSAAYEQMVYLESKYPKLKTIVHSAYASSNLTVYDFYLKNGVKCPKENLINIKKNVLENYKYVKKSKMYNFKKKMQFILFVYMFPLYKFAFRIYKKIGG